MLYSWRESAPILLCGQKWNSSWEGGLELDTTWPPRLLLTPIPVAYLPHLTWPPRHGSQSLRTPPSCISSHFPKACGPQKARVEGSPETLPTEAENSRQTLVHGQLWELLIIIISPLFLSNTSPEVPLTTHLALLNL